MFIDCSKLPNPNEPLEDDVYTSPDERHTIVVTNVPDWPPASVITYSLDGRLACCAKGHFAGVTVSIGVRPWGRLDRSAATRPAITRDPELVAQRLTAFGPHLRALREQYGLSMGDVSRALGCPPARLSMLELAEPDPVREDAGVREDEGRAALAELLTEAVAQMFVQSRGAGLEPVRPQVWETIHGALATAPATATMSTIMRARAKGEPGFDGPVDSTVLAGHLATALSQDGIIGPHREAGAAASLARAVRSPTAIDLMRRLAGMGSPSGPFKPGDKVMVPLTDSGHHGLAVVEQVDVGDDLEVAVRFSGAEAVTIISPLDLELANATGAPTYTGVDLSTGEGDDETVIFTAARMPNNQRRILEIQAGKWEGPEILERIRGVHARYRSTIGDAATQAAAGGLAGLLAKALQDYMSGCSNNGGSVLSALRDEAEVRELFVSVLATDEAQRLLRLHG